MFTSWQGKPQVLCGRADWGKGEEKTSSHGKFSFSKSGKKNTPEIIPWQILASKKIAQFTLVQFKFLILINYKYAVLIIVICISMR